MKTIIEKIANHLQAYQSPTIKQEWKDKNEEQINLIEKLDLPSGGGIDTGSRVDLKESSINKIVINTNFHHMNEGMYTHWTDHQVIVKPHFIGHISLEITGNDDNQILDYLHDIFYEALTTKIVRG